MTILRNLSVALFCIPAWVLAATHSQPAPPAGPPPVLVLPLADVPGVVSWTALAKVKQITAKDRIVPQFTPEISALNDRDVKLQGFMMPLEPGEKHKHFLLSVNPPSCPFCLPAGPEGIVEVKCKTPVKFSYDPILLSGKMAVLKDDPMGLFYRLTEALLVSDK